MISIINFVNFQERKANLEKFKQRQVNFLISTDVAARGIDVRGLPFMINVSLPDDKANYVHRIGRVGRAERMGLAISLVAKEREKVSFDILSCINWNLGEFLGQSEIFSQCAHPISPNFVT